jgi:hypothetical protein
MSDKTPGVPSTAAEPAKRFEHLSRWLIMAAGGIASVVGSSTVLSVFSPHVEKTAATSVLSIEDRITTIQAKLDNLNTKFKNVDDSLANISHLPKDAKLSFQLQQIQKTVANIQGRQDQLEQVIVTSPSKVLEIPLIKRDLDNLKDAQKAEIISIKEGVDRVYDLNKWLLGAMAVSIIALAIGSFLKSPGETK